MLQERFEQHTPLALNFSASNSFEMTKQYSESTAALLDTLQKAQAEMSEQIRVLREIENEGLMIYEGSPIKQRPCSPQIAVKLEEAIKTNDQTIALTKKAIQTSRHVIKDVLKECQPSITAAEQLSSSVVMSPENLSAMLESVKDQVQGLKDYFDQLKIRLMVSEQREQQLREQVKSLNNIASNSHIPSSATNNLLFNLNDSSFNLDSKLSAAEEVAQFFPEDPNFIPVFLM